MVKAEKEHIHVVHGMDYTHWILRPTPVTKKVLSIKGFPKASYSHLDLRLPIITVDMLEASLIYAIFRWQDVAFAACTGRKAVNSVVM